MMRRVSIKIKFQDSWFSKAAENYFHSNWYLLTITALMILPFAFRQYVLGLWLTVLATCLAMMLCEDILPSFAGFLFANMSVFELHRITNQEILSMSGIAVPVIASFIFHLVFYRRKNYRPGKTFWCQIAVSVAITLAGLGVTNTKEYFAIPTMYFCCFLGFGLLGILAVLDIYVPDNPEYIKKYFAKTMICVGFAVILMWCVAVIQDAPKMQSGFQVPYRQWKNNVGNLMLISVPATLYYATKSPRSWCFFMFAVLEFAAIIFSLSRGTMIMAIAMAPFELALYFIMIKDKKQRIVSALILGAAIAAVTIALIKMRVNFWAYLKEKLQVYEGEMRWKLYRLGWENFCKHPIFGVGFGYRNDEIYPLNDMAIFWYHSTPVQIIASMGIVGVLCYAYQLIVRLRLLIKRNSFNLFMLLAFIGFEGYSCINTGSFSPLPYAVLIVFMFIICEKCNNGKIKKNSINC